MPATIVDARAFLDQRLFQPALAAPDIPAKLSDKLRNTWGRLQHFRKPGDLLTYLDRFQGDDSPETRDALHALGLPAFEDLRGDFRKFLGISANEVTTLSDFVIGARYSTWDILMFARVYDPRHGGIFLIPNNPPHDVIFVKATLNGGKYPNQWIEPGSRLKYYCYSIKGKFDLDYKYNAAIRNGGDTPIFVFIRTDEDDFNLEGVFRYITNHEEPSGERWFELEKRDSTTQPYLVTDREYAAELDAKVGQSSKDDPAARKERLKNANKKPRKLLVQSTNYVRNPDVIAEVLARAAGVCEGCNAPAPFARKSDKTPYLEVHHVVHLADDGEDSVENALALCPNCHRKRHYG